MTTEPTTAIYRWRRARGRYLKTQDGAAPKREKIQKRLLIIISLFGGFD